MSAPAPPAPATSASFRKLGRNTAIYSVGVFAQRIVSVLMLPVYTRVMTPSDYGVLDLLSMVTDVTALLLTAGLVSGLQRFWFQAGTDEERRRLASTALLMQVGMASIGSVLLMLFAAPVAANALGGAGSPLMVRLAAANFTLAMLTNVPLILMQTQERARLYLAVTVSRIVLQVAFNLVFVVHLRMAATGMLLSALLTSVLLGGWASTWLLRSNGVHFSRHWLGELRRFGVPFQLAWAGAFLLTFGDRYFLQAAQGAASVGLYGMAYQFGFIVNQVAGQPFNQAWRPQRFQLANAPREQRDRATRQGFFYLALVLLTGATATCLFVEPFLRVMTTPEFYGAALLVPLIVLAYVIDTFGNAMGFGIEVSEKTRYNAFATWASALAALALYALLVPRLGGYGAALGTVGGFSVRTALLYHWSQRLWPVSYGVRRVLLVAAFGAAATVLYLLLRPAAFLPQLLFAMGLFAGYLVAVFAAALTAEERQLLDRAVHDLRHAIPILTRTG